MIFFDDFYNNITKIFTKKINNLDFNVDIGLCITLNKWVIINTKCCKIVSNIIKYLFYIEPKHYFMLLYFGLPFIKKPFFKKNKKNDIKKGKDDILIQKIQDTMGWNNNEISVNKIILDNILKDDKFKKELELDFGLKIK